VLNSDGIAIRKGNPLKIGTHFLPSYFDHKFHTMLSGIDS